MSTHAQAQAIVNRRIKCGEPFALLLRGFEGEAYDYLVRNPKNLPCGGGRSTYVTLDAGPGTVELAVCPALQTVLAMLTVASPASADSGQKILGALLPRLIMPTEGWIDDIKILIRLAHVIVVDRLSVNQRMRMEMEAIKEHGGPAASGSCRVRRHSRLYRQIGRYLYRRRPCPASNSRMGDKEERDSQTFSESRIRRGSRE